MMIYIYINSGNTNEPPHFSPPDCRQVLQSHFSPLVQGSASSGKVPLGRMEKMGFFEKLRENRPKFDG